MHRKKKEETRAFVTVPAVGNRDPTAWNAVAFQSQLSKNFSLNLGRFPVRNQRRLASKPSRDKDEKSKKGLRANNRPSHPEGEEYVVGAPLPPPTLAQKLGLEQQPRSLLTEPEWAEIKHKSNRRNDSQFPCSICQDRFGPQEQLLLSCSHVFHRVCLEAFERFSGQTKCPICRETNYEKRVVYEGARYHRTYSAILIQSQWRGYRARKWYSELRKRVPPQDRRLRLKYYEAKLSQLTNDLVTSVENSDAYSRHLTHEADRLLWNSKKVFEEFDLVAASRDAAAAAAASHSSSSSVDQMWVEAEKKALERGSTNCPICLSVCCAGRKKVALLTCSHVFHVACISAFEKFNDSDKMGIGMICPVCRSSYRRTLWTI
ncbi:RING finger protein 32-like [Oscarella lobularis]|uniref:RING finger protein 32-like n=1 Tax=Oscarella lobularis TaxID=121494 RepID=UPI003313D923